MRLHKGDAHAKAGSQNWRLSMAMELVACPSLLVVDSVPNSVSHTRVAKPESCAHVCQQASHGAHVVLNPLWRCDGCLQHQVYT